VTRIPKTFWTKDANRSMLIKKGWAKLGFVTALWWSFLRSLTAAGLSGREEGKPSLCKKTLQNGIL
jgi:hypothetical protein